MKKNAPLSIILSISVIFLLTAAFFNWNSINSYTSLNTETRSYARARVESIENSVMEKAEEGRYVGEQQITVRFLEGADKDQTVSLTNYISRTHNVPVSTGTKIIICEDKPQGTEPMYTVFTYDRTLSISILLLAFVAVMFFIGNAKGIRALLGVAYTLLLILLYTLRAIYHGQNPGAITAVTIVLSTTVSLVLLNGISRRTLSGILATLAGVCVTGIVFTIFAELFHVNGYNLDTIESLFMISTNTSMKIKPLLGCSVLISALGAVMDVAVSLSASLEELIQVNPKMSQQDLVHSGMNIGKDMIGTMSNTLILAFAGSSFTTLLVLMSLGYKAEQLLSSDFISIELVQGICATIGLVLTVPVTAFLASFLFTHKK